MLYKVPNLTTVKRHNWRRFIITWALVISLAGLFLVSYLQYHRQVSTACRLTVQQGYDIPPPFKATCIQQMGGFDDAG